MVVVGAVVPTVAPQTSSPNAKPGWWALLDVKTDAATAFNRIAARATKAGFFETPDSGADECTSTALGVYCRAFYIRRSRVLSVYVHVCPDCTAPVSAARIEAQTPTYKTPDTGSPIAGVSDKPTARLNITQRRKATDLPRPGEQLFPMPDGYPYPPLSVAPGSRTLGRAAAGQCERGFNAMLAATKSPAVVFREYRTIAEKQPGLGDGTSTRTRSASGRR